MIIVLHFTIKHFSPRRFIDAFNVPAGRLLLENTFNFCVMIEGHSLNYTNENLRSLY